MGTFWRQYVAERRKEVVASFNKLLKGNVSVSQAHAERDEIVKIFNELAEELQTANDMRYRQNVELARLQRELKKLTENN